MCEDVLPAVGMVGQCVWLVRSVGMLCTWLSMHALVTTLVSLFWVGASIINNQWRSTFNQRTSRAVVTSHRFIDITAKRFAKREAYPRPHEGSCPSKDLPSIGFRKAHPHLSGARMGSYTDRRIMCFRVGTRTYLFFMLVHGGRKNILN